MGSKKLLLALSIRTAHLTPDRLNRFPRHGFDLAYRD